MRSGYGSVRQTAEIAILVKSIANVHQNAVFITLMKPIVGMNVERQAAHVIEDFLGRLPQLDLKHIEREREAGYTDSPIDIVVEGCFAGKPLHLIVEVKSNGQPRSVRDAAHQLRRYRRNHYAHAIPIVMAPYLSPQAREACREENVGYLDFVGNALIAQDAIYIEREVPGRPEAERRALRSLYKPKSTRILRTLLREPDRRWRIAELADAAGVSVGHVSAVGVALRERGWAEQTGDGLTLVDPDTLLDSWSENYEPPRGEEYRCYTAFHGKLLADRLRGLALQGGKVALASFSAAEWLAPYVRHPNTFFYADEKGLATLNELLQLREAPKGANVIIIVPEEDGVLDDATKTGNDLVVTSRVQTYLDLMHAGDRGTEGAAELRHRLMGWRT